MYVVNIIWIYLFAGAESMKINWSQNAAYSPKINSLPLVYKFWIIHREAA